MTSRLRSFSSSIANSVSKHVARKKSQKPTVRNGSFRRSRTTLDAFGDTDIKVLDFIQNVFDGSVPDESMMYILVAVKDKTVRAVLWRQLLARLEKAASLPFVVATATFQYLEDLLSAVYRLALNENDFATAMNLLRFSFSVCWGGYVKGEETTFLFYSLENHDIFKTVTFWEYVFDNVLDTDALVLSDDVFRTGGASPRTALLILRRCMARVHLEEDMQLMLLDNAIAHRGLNFMANELVASDPEFEYDACISVDWADINSVSRKQSNNSVNEERRARRRQSAMTFVKPLGTQPSTVEKSLMQEARSNMLQELTMESTSRQQLGGPLFKPRRSVSDRGYHTNVAVRDPEIKQREVSRTLLSHERLIWRVRARVVSTHPQYSLQSTQGSLYMSNYCLFFEAWENKILQDDFFNSLFEIPLRMIERLERGEKDPSMVTVYAKDFRKLTFVCPFDDINRFEAFMVLCRRYAFEPFPAFVDNPTLSSTGYAANYFTFGHADKILSDEEFVFDFIDEFERQGVIRLDGQPSIWRVSHLNLHYKLCETYPSVLVVPNTISDDNLTSIAAYRSKGRLPCLTYRHVNGASLLRSAQPMTGVRQKRSRDDEQYLSEAGITVVFDARGKAAALGNTMMGKGTENMSNYPGIELLFCDVDNIHAVRKSLEKVVDLLYCEDQGDASFYSKLDDTKWLRHIRQILLASIKVVHQLHEECTTCLVHCSDGWDRTAQMCACAQIMVDPYFRTIRGFATLVEKDFLSFGHMLARRTGQLDANFSDSQRSPIFLQFLDCVWQIKRQYPCSFEFNDEFLEALMDAVYSCRFGTFLYNSDRERRACEKITDSESFWSYTLRRLPKFKNVNYIRRSEVLEPRPQMYNLNLWPYLFRFQRAFLERESTVPWSEARVQKINTLSQELKTLKERLRLLEGEDMAQEKPPPRSSAVSPIREESDELESDDDSSDDDDVAEPLRLSVMSLGSDFYVPPPPLPPTQYMAREPSPPPPPIAAPPPPPESFVANLPGPPPTPPR